MGLSKYLNPGKKEFWDPAGLKKDKPSTELSHAEKAQLKRNRSLLDEEIEESEKRLKAMARGKLGYKSLLANSAPTNATAPPPASSGGTNSSLVRTASRGARKIVG